MKTDPTTGTLFPKEDGAVHTSLEILRSFGTTVELQAWREEDAISFAVSGGYVAEVSIDGGARKVRASMVSGPEPRGIGMGASSRTRAVLRRWRDSINQANPSITNEYIYMRPVEFDALASTGDVSQLIAMRYDAPLWQVPFELTEQYGETVVTIAPVMLGHYSLPVPVELDLPEDPREEKWIARVEAGGKSVEFTGQGMFSLHSLQGITSMIPAHFADTMFSIPPMNESCNAPSCTNDLSDYWNDPLTTSDERLITRVQGLCVQCARVALTSLVPDTASRPNTW